VTLARQDLACDDHQRFKPARRPRRSLPTCRTDNQSLSGVAATFKLPRCVQGDDVASPATGRRNGCASGPLSVQARRRRLPHDQARHPERVHSHGPAWAAPNDCPRPDYFAASASRPEQPARPEQRSLANSFRIAQRATRWRTAWQGSGQRSISQALDGVYGPGGRCVSSRLSGRRRSSVRA
jgi:hypothetical protein